MITRQNRFHGHNSLRHVYQKGRTVKSAAVSVKYVRNDRRDRYRAAVVVSRKVHKSAVVRNRLRRQLYETIRLSGVHEPYDIVVTVFEEAMRLRDTSELRTQLARLLADAGLGSGNRENLKNHGMIKEKEQ